MGVANLKERAERIREIAEDFGAANFWASPAACEKGHLVQSKETLELAERWALGRPFIPNQNKNVENS